LPGRGADLAAGVRGYRSLGKLDSPQAAAVRVVVRWQRRRSRAGRDVALPGAGCDRPVQLIRTYPIPGCPKPCTWRALRALHRVTGFLAEARKCATKPVTLSQGFFGILPAHRLPAGTGLGADQAPFPAAMPNTRHDAQRVFELGKRSTSKPCRP